MPPPRRLPQVGDEDATPGVRAYWRGARAMPADVKRAFMLAFGLWVGASVALGIVFVVVVRSISREVRSGDVAVPARLASGKEVRAPLDAPALVTPSARIVAPAALPAPAAVGASPLRPVGSATVGPRTPPAPPRPRARPNATPAPTGDAVPKARTVEAPPGVAPPGLTPPVAAPPAAPPVIPPTVRTATPARGAAGSDQALPPSPDSN